MGYLRLLADMDDKLVTALRKALAEEKNTYKGWLTNQIKNYLEKKGGGKGEEK